MENRLPELNTTEWNLLCHGAYGTVLEKKDGSVIITGTWDGHGVSYKISEIPKPKRQENKMLALNMAIALPNNNAESLIEQAQTIYDWLNK